MARTERESVWQTGPEAFPPRSFLIGGASICALWLRTAAEQFTLYESTQAGEVREAEMPVWELLPSLLKTKIGPQSRCCGRLVTGAAGQAQTQTVFGTFGQAGRSRIGLVAP